MNKYTVKIIKKLADENQYDAISTHLSDDVLNIKYFIEDANIINYTGNVSIHRPSSINVNKVTLLHDAIKMKDKRLIEIILDSDYEIKYVLDTKSCSVFDYAIELDDIDIMKRLIDRFKNSMNEFDRMLISTFQRICKSGNLEVIKYAIENGADRNCVFEHHGPSLRNMNPLDFIEDAFRNNISQIDDLLDTINILYYDYNMKFSINLFQFALSKKIPKLISCLLKLEPTLLDYTFDFGSLLILYGVDECHRLYRSKSSTITCYNYKYFHLLCMSGNRPKIEEFIDKNMKSNTIQKYIREKDCHDKYPLDYLSDDLHISICRKYVMIPFKKNIVHCFLWRLLMRPTTLYIKRIVSAFD